MSIHRYRKHLLFIAAYLSLPLFMIAVHPENLPVPLLIVPFLLLFMTLFLTFKVLLQKFKQHSKLSKKRIYILSAIGSGLPVLLIVFQTLHQLSIKDVIITVAILAGVSLYVGRLDLD